MTQKLYDTNSHLKNFIATVLSCRPDGRFYQIELDQTAFFPEGGGQNGDTGFLNSIRVLDTQIKESVIFHKTERPLTVGEKVTGKIDWEPRFRRMQNHSGEHIVSGLIHSAYGFDNVGFHMGHEDMTIDLNGYLTPEQLLEIEQKANRVVWKNVPIRAEYPDAEILNQTAYRSKLDLTENVRLVTIEGVDVCACCAPHVNTTGEIGLIRIVDSLRYKGGVRIHLLCGEDALMDIERKGEQLRLIACELSAKQSEAFEAVQRVQAEEAELKHTLHELKGKLIALKAAAVKETDGNLCFFEEDTDMDSMRELVNQAVKKCGGFCGVFCGSDQKGYSYVIGSENVSVSQKAKEINAALNGRGGGRDPMIQGSVKADKKDILAYFNAVTPY